MVAAVTVSICTVDGRIAGHNIFLEYVVNILKWCVNHEGFLVV